MATIIRKTWPRVRRLKIDGAIFSRVDGRRKGTAGKQETVKSKEVALKRAGEIEDDFKEHGAEGLALSGDLRTYALKADELLRPTISNRPK